MIPLLIKNKEFNQISNLVLVEGATVINGSLKVGHPFTGILGIVGTLSVNRGKVETTSLVEDHYLVSTSDDTNGILLTDNSTYYLPRTVISGYTNGINAINSSVGNLVYAKIAGCVTGAKAAGASYLYVNPTGFFSNTTDCDPTVNTQGNKYALIDDGN